MKKTYVKPEMKGEAFIANEYVATCYQLPCSMQTEFSVYIENGKKYSGYNPKEGDKLLFRNEDFLGCYEQYSFPMKGLPDGLDKATVVTDDIANAQAQTELGVYGDGSWSYPINVIAWQNPDDKHWHAYSGGLEIKADTNASI